MNLVSNLEPTKKSYCSKIDENNCAPTKKPKVLSVSVKLFCLEMKFETISNRCQARDQYIPTLRWLKIVSSTNISMGHCNHSLSLDA